MVSASIFLKYRKDKGTKIIGNMQEKCDFFKKNTKYLVNPKKTSTFARFLECKLY
jgi:hypothetical protein